MKYPTSSRREIARFPRTLFAEYLQALPIRLYTAVLILACLSGCSLFRSDSLSVAPPPDTTQTLTFIPIQNSKAFRVKIDEASVIPDKLYGVSMKECDRRPSVSVPGKSRQLLVGFDDLSILERRTLEAAHAVAVIHATASVEADSISLVGYTWNYDRCVYDFLVWSQDPDLLLARPASENVTLEILDHYIASTVNNYVY